MRGTHSPLGHHSGHRCGKVCVEGVRGEERGKRENEGVKSEGKRERREKEGEEGKRGKETRGKREGEEEEKRKWEEGGEKSEEGRGGGGRKGGTYRTLL